MAAHPRTAVYPGTFDPLTNGHVDIIERGLGLFDRIIVAILVNSGKQPLFDIDERVGIIREVFASQPAVEVETFDGLLVDYVHRRHASVIVRGLRTVSDFDYERQMALMNRHLRSDIETVFMMPSEQVHVRQFDIWSRTSRRSADRSPDWCRRSSKPGSRGVARRPPHAEHEH